MNNRKKTLNFRPSAGHVKQKFPYGRSKSVVIEKRRKRIIIPGKTMGSSVGTIQKPMGISDIEMQRRRKALEAERLEEQQRKIREHQDMLKREREEKEHQRLQEQKQREKIELAKKKERARIEAEKKAAEELQEKARQLHVKQVNKTVKADSRPPAPKPTPTLPPRQIFTKRESPSHNSKKLPRSPKNKTGQQRRRRAGKLTINQALAADINRQRSLASMKRKQERQRRDMKSNKPQEREKIVRDVQIPEAITVQELANRMAEKINTVIKTLMINGIIASQNQTIDADTAQLIVEEFGHRVLRVSDADVEDAIDQIEDQQEDLKPRAPVVTVMGHVDHGKTSVLDALRKTNVASGEAGGITQHIGAYQITTDDGTVLSFIDTPGHAAFTSMRARGAQITDIVVLVVAANDGVMPQTIEAISHAKAADVPLIVALNKMDSAGADAMRVRQELLQHKVVVETLSGDVQDVEISALKGDGLDKLIEAILLQAEILELKSNPDRAACGAVIEAKLDIGRGPVATVLIKHGTLKKGDVFIVGRQWGKVRALIDSQGCSIMRAAPSVPVEVLGLNGTPEAGDILNVVESEAEAREIANYRIGLARDKRAAVGASATLDQLLAKAKADQKISELAVVIKTDVQGSCEAILQALYKVGNDEVCVRVLHSGVGAITENDVTLAEASKALIIGFNVRANAPARNTANQMGVKLRYYSVLYTLIDDIKIAASGLLSAEVKENFIGYANIKEVFKISGIGKIGGCLVTDGIARRSAKVRLLRDNVVIHEGRLKTLKRFKDEVKEVQNGQECGMAFEKYDNIKVGDVIEIFETKSVDRVLL